MSFLEVKAKGKIDSVKKCTLFIRKKVKSKFFFFFLN